MESDIIAMAQIVLSAITTHDGDFDENVLIKKELRQSRISFTEPQYLLFNHYFFIRLLSLFIASIVFSLSPKEVSLNQPAPFLPKPSPGVPTT